MSDANAANPLPWREPERVEQLLALLAERIVELDGAMGTMIQRHELDEAGYRGERFAEGYDVQDVQVPRRAGSPGAADEQHFAEGHQHGPNCGCGGDLKGNNDRTKERRVGKEWGSKGRSRWRRYN